MRLMIAITCGAMAGLFLGLTLWQAHRGEIGWAVGDGACLIFWLVMAAVAVKVRVDY